MRRRLAVLAVLAIVVLAGCTGGVVSEEELAEDATYDWETNATVTVDVDGSSYQAVYQIRDRSSVELYHLGTLGGEEPIPIRAIQFRYSNGTVANASAMDVAEQNSRTVVTFPEDEGQFAYTANSPSGDLFFPVVTNGSYEVILPPGTRISAPIIGAAQPGGYEKTVNEDRVHLFWESPSADEINVTYYLERDLYIFGGLIALLGLVALAGVVYFRYQLRNLEEERESSGLDMEDER